MHFRRLLAGLFLCMTPFLAGCGSSSSSGAPPPTATPGMTPVRAPTSGGCLPAKTDGNGGPYPAAISSSCTGMKAVEVDIVSDPKITGGFAPSNITISRGTTVTWVWKSGGHNLAPFHTAIEDTGFRYSQTFTTRGDYQYQCQVHPGQYGIVHVK